MKRQAVRKIFYILEIICFDSKWQIFAQHGQLESRTGTDSKGANLNMTSNPSTFETFVTSERPGDSSRANKTIFEFFWS